MHHKASPEIFRRAKKLRDRMTPAEAHLWESLRARKLNDLHFRRQHPVSKFIVDFYCHKFKLAIELDGEIHDQTDQKEQDLKREEDLKALGIHVLRFRNDFALNETQEVLRRILSTIEEIKSKNIK